MEPQGRDPQRNRAFFSGMVRGASNLREGSKILFFLFRSRVVRSSYISEARGRGVLRTTSPCSPSPKFCMVPVVRDRVSYVVSEIFRNSVDRTSNTGLGLLRISVLPLSPIRRLAAKVNSAIFAERDRLKSLAIPKPYGDAPERSGA